jgi:hypothetical protein
MFKLVVSNTVLVQVRGSINDADGKAQPFDFDLVATRSTADEIAALVRDGGDLSLKDVMADRITGWRKVLDASGAALPFSDDGLQSLLNIAGMPAIVFRGYLEACGAKGKEKN